ncbi:hypothetical protein A3Q29_13010 [Providencia stuartii]|uniref:HTH marR-type domain-containing protein n=1 Tax=Providencia stuartii TaxID=588 RepID=A0A1S1HVR5_PROST|nr:hypothetical protein A3Q29_13010 [Providencia stuartii]
MPIKPKILPSRDIIQSTHDQNNLEYHVSSVDLFLNLLLTSDNARAEIYDVINKKYSISEGKFILLMSLYGECELTTHELAMRMAVTSATVSVMVKRMLDDPNPLISVSINEKDTRSRLIKLSPRAYQILEEIIPLHIKNINSYIEPLNLEERELLLSLLKN